MPDPAPDPYGAAAANAASRLLHQEIARLPASLKDPLILTALEGLSHKEAAEVLNLNAKAVELRVYRAKKRLAEALAGAI